MAKANFQKLKAFYTTTCKIQVAEKHAINKMAEKIFIVRKDYNQIHTTFNFLQTYGRFFSTRNQLYTFFLRSNFKDNNEKDM